MIESIKFLSVSLSKCHYLSCAIAFWSWIRLLTFWISAASVAR